MKKLILFIIVSTITNQLFSQDTCQCVAFVKNAFGIKGGVGKYNGAKDYNAILTNKVNNFKLVLIPQKNDIIIMQPSFGNISNDFNMYGHIALVDNIVKHSNGNLTIKLLGANQSKLNWSVKHGCKNVTYWSITITNKNRNSVGFYRR